MLAADKQSLVARLAVNSLGIRQKQLDFYVERYSNLSSQSSLIAGFAFTALVVLRAAVVGVPGAAG